jgi:hypothetical protein
MSFKRVYTKRLTAFLILFALIFSQIAISSHAAVHPDHSYSVASSDTARDHDKHDEQHHDRNKCPEYLLAKSLQSATSTGQALDLGVFVSSERYSFTNKDFAGRVGNAEYEARAPPIFLI